MPRLIEIDELLARYPEPVRATAAAARAWLEDALPDVEERADVPAKMLAYSYGPGYKGAVCTLILSQKEVKLGIVYGAALPDPNKLMTGAGKVHRHVPLRSAVDLKRPGLKELLQAAVKACRARMAKP